MTSGTGLPSRPVVVACVFCGTANRVNLARLDAGPKCGQCGKPIRLDRPVKATDGDIDRTIKEASVPVVVDFYADWCGPCHMMAPILDDVAHRKAGEALFLKLDTDANPVTPDRLGIRGLPTLVAFRNGREHGRHVGVADAAAVEKLLA